eukprot:5780799-Amphidinium_carterae.1
MLKLSHARSTFVTKCRSFAGHVQHAQLCWSSHPALWFWCYRCIGKHELWQPGVFADVKLWFCMRLSTYTCTASLTSAAHSKLLNCNAKANSATV